MDLSNVFPFWEKLTEEQRQRLAAGAVLRTVKAGVLLHQGGDCMGLLAVRTGQLRAYILSDQGREITPYRLFDRHICLLPASRLLRHIQFDVTISAEKDTQLWVIPSDVYQSLMEESAAVANYTNDLMGSRFSEVMWLMEQVMWKSFDARLASFLLEESLLEGTASLRLTHERIANHLGTAREVVTRMLRYFQSEGMVRLTRGTVALTDLERLRRLSEA